MRKMGWVAAAAWVAVAGTGHATAQNVKAGVDAWGHGDFAAAVEQWRGPAVHGDADAQFNLGQAYKLGRGVPLDPALAESWFRKAAVQGHLQAEDNYGLALFQAGRKAEAVPWLEKSVAHGEPRGQLVLGTMLFNGDGVPRDYPRAYALMTLASQAGLKSASETLAQMDAYVTPADRERGTALAQRYAADARAPIAGAGSRTLVADGQPNRTAPMVTASRSPTRTGPARAPARAPDRPTPDRIADHASPPPRPAPSPAPARSAPAKIAAGQPSEGGGWRIQLGAFSTQAHAATQWAQVRGRLGGAQPVYARAGTFIRLQAGGFTSRAAAQRGCASSGVTCVVVAP